MGKRAKAVVTGVVTVVVPTILCWGGIVLLRRFQFFSFSGTDSRATVTGAALALSGVLVTSAVTFVGLLIKFSADERAHALAVESERRMRLEAVIQAAGLLGTSSGTNASTAQTGASLFALAKLGQIDVALALLGPLWRSRKIESDLAALVVSEGLASKDGEQMNQAAQILELNSRSLVQGEQLCFPLALWNMSLPLEAKALVLGALANALMEKKWFTWDPGIIRWCVEFGMSAARDRLDFVGWYTHTLLDGLLRLPIWDGITQIESSSGPILLKDVRQKATDLGSKKMRYADWQPKFASWCGEARSETSGVGERQ